MTGLPIAREMYNKFFLGDSIIMDKNALPFSKAFISEMGGLFEEDKHRNYTDWVEAFISEMRGLFEGDKHRNYTD